MCYATFSSERRGVYLGDKDKTKISRCVKFETYSEPDVFRLLKVMNTAEHE